MRKLEEMAERFRRRYGTPITQAQLIVEREAIGMNVGANGYTTAHQADLLAVRLDLSAGRLLLDLGCGRGWPGLYLANKTGCSAVLADLPETALRFARVRSEEDGTSERVSIVRASAVHPPLRAKTFDAVCHTDTL